ncbi:MAG: phage holin family protein [Chloroflexi bacterium]|nr:phage holin family protein [Chloroflexota bacterium]
MDKFLIRWAINGLALYAAIYLLPGLGVENDVTSTYVWFALIFGLLNASVRPILKLLTCPLILLTLGTFTLVINTVMFYITRWVGSFFGMDLHIENFWAAFLGAIIVSIISLVLSMIFRNELKARRKRRKRKV